MSRVMRETRTVYVEKIGENKYKAKYVILPGDAKRYTPKEAHEKTYINCYGIPQEYRDEYIVESTNEHVPPACVRGIIRMPQ